MAFIVYNLHSQHAGQKYLEQQQQQQQKQLLRWRTKSASAKARKRHQGANTLWAHAHTNKRVHTHTHTVPNYSERVQIQHTRALFVLYQTQRCQQGGARKGRSGSVGPLGQWRRFAQRARGLITMQKWSYAKLLTGRLWLEMWLIANLSFVGRCTWKKKVLMPIRQYERDGRFANMPQLVRKYVNTYRVCARLLFFSPLPLNEPIGEGMFAFGAGAYMYAQPEDYSTNQCNRSQLAPLIPPPLLRQSFLKPSPAEEGRGGVFMMPWKYKQVHLLIPATLWLTKATQVLIVRPAMIIHLCLFQAARVESQIRPAIVSLYSCACFSFDGRPESISISPWFAAARVSTWLTARSRLPRPTCEALALLLAQIMVRLKTRHELIKAWSQKCVLNFILKMI